MVNGEKQEAGGLRLEVRGGSLWHFVTLSLTLNVFIKLFLGKISKVDFFTKTIFIFPGIIMVSGKIFNCLFKKGGCT